MNVVIKTRKVLVFYIYYSVHRNILWNDQQMQQCAVRFISLQVHLQRNKSHCTLLHLLVIP